MKPEKLLRFLFAVLLVFGMNFLAAGAVAETARQNCQQAVSTSGDILAAPTVITLSRIPAGFLVTWTPSAQNRGNRIGYELVRATSLSGPYVVVGTVTNGVNSFRDTTVAPENIYYYKVRAFVGDRYSPYSKPVSGELTALPGQ